MRRVRSVGPFPPSPTATLFPTSASVRKAPTHKPRFRSLYFLNAWNLSDATFNFTEKAMIGFAMALLIISVVGLSFLWLATSVSELDERVTEDRDQLEKIYAKSTGFLEAQSATNTLRESAAKNVDLNLKLAINEIAKRITFEARNRRGESDGQKNLSDVLQFDQTQETFLSKKKKKRSWREMEAERARLADALRGAADRLRTPLSLDPDEPPVGLEIGYVPIVVHQERSTDGDCATPLQEALSRVTEDLLFGEYTRLPAENDWHVVTVSRDDVGLWWENAAGARWRLYFDAGVLETRKKEARCFLWSCNTGYILPWNISSLARPI